MDIKEAIDIKRYKAREFIEHASKEDLINYILNVNDSIYKVDKLKEKLKQDIHRRCNQNYPEKSIAFAERTLLNKRDQELLDYLKELEV